MGPTEKQCGPARAARGRSESPSSSLWPWPSRRRPSRLGSPSPFAGRRCPALSLARRRLHHRTSLPPCSVCEARRGGGAETRRRCLLGRRPTGRRAAPSFTPSVLPRSPLLVSRLAKMSGNASASSRIGDDMDAPLATQQVKRSKVWEHFEKDLVVVGDVPKAVCKYCGIKLTCTRRSGTSSLLSHISEYFRLIEDEVRVSFVASLKKKASDVGFIFNSKRSRQLMTKLCIHAEVAFRKFEDPYFEEWMESMQPTFKVVGRHTIRNDCILEHDEMKDRLKLELKTLDSRICLTSDMWTYVQKLGYMCVTAHYIDANFVLKKKVISFKDVKYLHTTVAIEEALCGCLSDWGIKRKLFTLTLDNAANNTAAVDTFLETQDHGLLLDGSDFHVRCSAHILNILVQDGTKHLHTSIERIRDLFRHVNSSGGRTQSFNVLAKSKGLPEKAGLVLVEN